MGNNRIKMALFFYVLRNQISFEIILPLHSKSLGWRFFNILCLSLSYDFEMIQICVVVMISFWPGLTVMILFFKSYLKFISNPYRNHKHQLKDLAFGFPEDSCVIILSIFAISADQRIQSTLHEKSRCWTQTNLSIVHQHVASTSFRLRATAGPSLVKKGKSMVSSILIFTLLERHVPQIIPCSKHFIHNFNPIHTSGHLRYPYISWDHNIIILSQYHHIFLIYIYIWYYNTIIVVIIFPPQRWWQRLQRGRGRKVWWRLGQNAVTCRAELRSSIGTGSVWPFRSKHNQTIKPPIINHDHESWSWILNHESWIMNNESWIMIIIWSSRFKRCLSMCFPNARK